MNQLVSKPVTLNPVASATGSDVLLVEDNRADACLTSYLVKERFDQVAYDLVHVSTLSQAILELGRREFACILLDLGLPDMSGCDTVRALRDASPNTPLVVLTGDKDERVGVEALHSGAQEYLIKGETDGRLLTRTIRFAVERARMERATAKDTARQPVSLPFDMSF